MQRHLLTAVLGCMAACAASGQQSPDAVGVIRGVLIDETGLHVAGAEVRVDLQDGRPRGAVLPFAETDKDGSFAINHLVLGTYYVWAEKKVDGGYADTFRYSTFQPEIPPMTVQLTPRYPSADITVTLPSPAKVSWSATDAVTGKPVAMSMRVYRWLVAGDDNPRCCYDEAHGVAAPQPNEYYMLAPPEVDVGLSGRADGYEVWHHPTMVRLKSGDNLTLDIKLQPLAK